MADEYILETDGSYNSELPYAGIGGVLYKNGQIIDYFSLVTNKHNEEHEAVALLYGMILAKQHGITDLICKSDALTNVDYFNNNKTTKDNIQIFSQVNQLRKEFNTVKFKHHTRDYNQAADYLSTIYKKNGGYSTTSTNKVEHEFFSEKDIHFPENKILPVTAPGLIFHVPIGHNEDIILNIIEYQNKENNLLVKRIPVKNNLTEITNIMSTEVKAHKQTAQICFSGQYSTVIRTHLNKVRGLGRSLNKAFLDLAPYWEQINNNEPIPAFVKPIKPVKEKVVILPKPTNRHNVFEVKRIMTNHKEPDGSIVKIPRIALKFNNYHNDMRKINHQQFIFENDIKPIIKKIHKILSMANSTYSIEGELKEEVRTRILNNTIPAYKKIFESDRYVEKTTVELKPEIIKQDTQDIPVVKDIQQENSILKKFTDFIKLGIRKILKPREIKKHQM